MMVCVHLSSDVDAAQVGGKAHSLGLRVPPAFVITREAMVIHFFSVSYDWNAEDVVELREKRRDELLSEFRGEECVGG